MEAEAGRQFVLLIVEVSSVRRLEMLLFEVQRDNLKIPSKAS